MTNFIRMLMRNVFVNVFKSDAVIWWAAIGRVGGKMRGRGRREEVVVWWWCVWGGEREREEERGGEERKEGGSWRINRL